VNSRPHRAVTCWQDNTSQCVSRTEELCTVRLFGYDIGYM
jgi:hypothetical protein